MRKTLQNISKQYKLDPSQRIKKKNYPAMIMLSGTMIYWTNLVESGFKNTDMQFVLNTLQDEL